MPEKRPFERLPADVSPINYSLCLKPDLLDFTFEGKLEAAAQVRRPSGAGGEQLGRACGLDWEPGGWASAPGLGAGWRGDAGWRGEGRAPPGGCGASGPGVLCCSVGAGPGAALRSGRAGPAHLCGRPPPPSLTPRGLGVSWEREDAGVGAAPVRAQPPDSVLSLVLPTPLLGIDRLIGMGRSSARPAATLEREGELLERGVLGGRVKSEKGNVNPRPPCRVLSARSRLGFQDDPPPPPTPPVTVRQ